MDSAPELSVRGGYPWPAGLPRGECILTTFADGTLRIDHADPRVLISAELLAQVALDPAPGASLTMAPIMTLRPGAPLYEGAVLRIDGVNRTVIYRITEYIPAVHGYIGEWPD